MDSTWILLSGLLSLTGMATCVYELRQQQPHAANSFATPGHPLSPFGIVNKAADAGDCGSRKFDHLEISRVTSIAIHGRAQGIEYAWSTR